MSSSILHYWLTSLNLAVHHQTFLDNGYDDLEICKQVSIHPG